jgi:hypothetical protein
MPSQRADTQPGREPGSPVGLQGQTAGKPGRPTRSGCSQGVDGSQGARGRGVHRCGLPGVPPRPAGVRPQRPLRDVQVAPAEVVVCPRPQLLVPGQTQGVVARPGSPGRVHFAAHALPPSAGRPGPWPAPPVPGPPRLATPAPPSGPARPAAATPAGGTTAAAGPACGAAARPLEMAQGNSSGSDWARRYEELAGPGRKPGDPGLRPADEEEPLAADDPLAGLTDHDIDLFGEAMRVHDEENARAREGGGGRTTPATGRSVTTRRPASRVRPRQNPLGPVRPRKGPRHQSRRWTSARPPRRRSSRPAPGRPAPASSTRKTSRPCTRPSAMGAGCSSATPSRPPATS